MGEPKLSGPCRRFLHPSSGGHPCERPYPRAPSRAGAAPPSPNSRELRLNLPPSLVGTADPSRTGAGLPSRTRRTRLARGGAHESGGGSLTGGGGHGRLCNDRIESCYGRGNSCFRRAPQRRPHRELLPMGASAMTVRAGRSATDACSSSSVNISHSCMMHAWAASHRGKPNGAIVVKLR